MSHIFISYSTRDKDYAFKLADKLRQEGFDVWIDKNRLGAGENWWESIVYALWGCGAFIVILTPESDKSGYVQREIAIAANRGKPLFPLLLVGDLDTPNWQFFVRTHYQDVRDGDLPSPDFYERLSEHLTPRQSGEGQDISHPTRPEKFDTGLQEIIKNPPKTYPDNWFQRFKKLLFQRRVLTFVLVAFALSILMAGFWQNIATISAPTSTHSSSPTSLPPQKLTNAYETLVSRSTLTAEAAKAITEPTQTLTPTVSQSQTRTPTLTVSPTPIETPTSTPNCVVTEAYETLVARRLTQTPSASIPTPSKCTE